ncbi:DUF1992 domain-containing protein [Pseudooceanicola onchidii]|uniref:DnaJ family domain-containing protein n=1 Tax=Pseudooceanicola onchidii TaxID=2562279 RepID=UPI0010AA1250|nr:DUF1992 domain-containing protein [Pseudooceanicola onchidii]
MDHPLIDLISAKIAEAERNGDFDNLPGAGKPLPRVDDPENALIRRIMEENRAEPEFVTLSRRLTALRAELVEESDRTKRREIMTEMSMMEARIEMARRAFAR